MIAAGAPDTTLVVIGDSLTENGTWPERLCAEAGWSLQRAGRSGQTSTEVAVRVGARAVDFVEGETSARGEVAVVPDPLPGPVREHVHTGMDDIRVRGTLGDRPGCLVHRVSAAADEGWSFCPDAAAPGTPGARRTFLAERLSVPAGAVVVIWCGRNNPGPEVLEDVAAIAAGLRRDSITRVLVLGVHAAAFEPEGAPGRRAVLELNQRLAERFGERFVDVQSALVRATETTDGVAAAPLRSDDVHLSVLGDAVVARAIRARVVELGWWPDPQRA